MPHLAHDAEADAPLQTRPSPATQGGAVAAAHQVSQQQQQQLKEGVAEKHAVEQQGLTERQGVDEGGAGMQQEEEGMQGQMLVVEAAALGASSPGAVVRVPTSTVLSQADHIALRYQHQASLLPQPNMYMSFPA